MVIAIHLEVSARELDSKILLGVVAASRGFEVVVGDVIAGASYGFLPKSVFHTKSISPSPKILARHKKIRALGHRITNQDEEGPGADYGVTDAYLARFGAESFAQIDAHFCWGEEELEALRRGFGSFASKLFLTGSPRGDLWSPRFRNYWGRSDKLPKEPFVLFSSNMGIVRPHPANFYTQSAIKRKRRDAISRLALTGQKYRALASFVEAIEFLSMKLDSGTIVLRPHPAEDLEVWERLLEDLPRVRVVRDGAISDWLVNTVALVHNGCTTGIEAALLEVRAISYTPHEQDFLRLPNDLGLKAQNLEELEQLVRNAFNTHIPGAIDGLSPKDEKILRKKILSHPTELAAERIVTIWETLVSKSAISKTRLLLFRVFLAVKKLRDECYKLVGSSRKRAQVHETQEKFPRLKASEVRMKVDLLCKELHIDLELCVEMLGERTFVIRPRN